MDTSDTRSKLKNILDGIIIERAADNCTATRNILCASFSTSTTVKRDFESKVVAKKEQVEFLKTYASERNLSIKQAPNESEYLTRGGESNNLLGYNGFENTLRNGLPTSNYYNKELGLILKDIYDEKVIVKANTLFFIDTVFYTLRNYAGYKENYFLEYHFCPGHQSF
ncbi:hypothetical protein [Chitinophaga sp.]|uniref:putative polyvalent protein kinase domain-containing protein n=1 Tax=Chitinophaga sp. TaxID=1869181 RepID=UPI002F94AFAD